MFPELTRHTRVLEIVGDTIRVKAEGAAFGDLAIVENVDGETSQAKVVALDRDIVSLQVFVIMGIVWIFIEKYMLLTMMVQT